MPAYIIRAAPFVAIVAVVAAVIFIDVPAASSERKERLYMCEVASILRDLDLATDAQRARGYPEDAQAHIIELAARLDALQPRYRTGEMLRSSLGACRGSSRCTN